MESLSPFLEGSFIPCNMPVYPGAPPDLVLLSFTEFVSFMLDRLYCFVEEFTAYRLQSLMPPEITIREIPLAERPAEMPERFQVTLTSGGHTPWNLFYHASKFEEA